MNRITQPPFLLTTFLCASLHFAIIDTLADEPTAHTTAQPIAALITLNNNSWLHGNVTAIEPDGSINWLHHTSNLEIKIPHSQAHSIYFPAVAKEPPLQADFIRLKNKVGLHGKVTKMDESTLEIISDFAGRLTIPRESIHGIHLNSDQGGRITFNSMPPLEQWAYRKENIPQMWRLQNDTALVYDGSGIEYISCDVNFPDVGFAEFELEWEDSLNTNIFLCHVNEQSENQISYRFNIRNNTLTTTFEYNPGGHSRSNPEGNINISDHIADATSAKFKIFIDRIHGVIVMNINDQTVGVWEDSSQRTPPGGDFQIRGNPGHPTTLRNLIVREWSGYPNPAHIDTIVAQGQSDEIHGHTNNPATGTITQISTTENNDRIIHLLPENDDEPMIIAAAEVHFSILANKIQPIPAVTNQIHSHTANILMTDGNHFPASNIEINENTISFQIFNNPQTLTAPFNEIVRIDFNPVQ